MVSFKLFITLLPLALAAVTRVPLVDDLLSEVDNLVVGLVNPDEDIVLDKYIVTLKDSLSEANINDHIAWVKGVDLKSIVRLDNSGVEKVWSNIFKGYSGTFDGQTVKEILANKDVTAVEPVRTVNLFQNAVQTDSPWGLGSVSHRTPSWREYLYQNPAGANTWAYVVDTGINTQHTDFEGRAINGYNAYPNAEFKDVSGHGTHCAGTIAGRTYGVAKQARVVAVKVFHDGGSSTDIVMDGFQWAVNNITKTPGRLQRSIISMSLGGSRSDAVNKAIDAAYKAGVLSVVAAGNSGADAKGYSPASAPNALTVGAVDIRNNRATFSNFGSLVDIFAPGVDITSTWIGSNTASRSLSGTSMACPHVAGLALYLISKDNLKTPDSVTSSVKNLGTKNAVKTPGAGSPNLLAYNGAVAKLLF